MGTLTLKLNADEEAFVRAAMRMTESMRKAEDGTKKFGEHSKKSTKDATEGLAETGKVTEVLGSSLQSLALKFFSVAAAAGVARAAINQMNETRERGLTGLQTEAQAFGPLLQLPDAERNIAESRKTMAERGVAAGPAANLQFMLQSQFATQFREHLAKLFGTTDPGLLARGAQTLTAAFGPQIGDLRQNINKLLAASAESVTAVEEFGPAASTAARSFGLIGATEIELLSSLSVLSKATKSAEVAGTQLGAFGLGMYKHGAKGGLWAAVTQAETETAGMTEKEMTEYFGEKTGMVAFLALRDSRREIQALAPKIAAAGAEPMSADYIQRIAQKRKEIPELAAVETLAREERAAEMAETETHGIKEAAEKTAIAQVRIGLAQANEGALTSLAANTAAHIAEWSNAGPKGVKAAGLIPIIFRERLKQKLGMAPGPGLEVYSGTTQPATSQPAGTVVNNYYGDNYSLNQRAAESQPAAGAPVVGLD